MLCTLYMGNGKKALELIENNLTVILDAGEDVSAEERVGVGGGNSGKG